MVSCGGSATNSGGDGDGDGDAKAGDGDSGGDGDGDGPSSGGSGTLGDGDGDGPGTGGYTPEGDGDGDITCGDVAYPVATIQLIGAPVDGGVCLAKVEVTGHDEDDVICNASESDCYCTLWSGSLIEGTHTITVLDPDGSALQGYSGPYPYSPPTGPCGGQAYETIEIEYGVGPEPY